MNDWHKQRAAQAAAETSNKNRAHHRSSAQRDAPLTDDELSPARNHHMGNVSGRAHRKKMEQSMWLLPEAEECLIEITERLNKLKEITKDDRDAQSLINYCLYRYTLFEEKRDRCA